MWNQTFHQNACDINLTPRSTSSFAVGVNSCYLLAVSHRIALQSVEWPFCGLNMSHPALSTGFQWCQACCMLGRLRGWEWWGGTISLTHVCLFRIWHSAASREGVRMEPHFCFTRPFSETRVHVMQGLRIMMKALLHFLTFSVVIISNFSHYQYQ